MVQVSSNFEVQDPELLGKWVDQVSSILASKTRRYLRLGWFRLISILMPKARRSLGLGEFKFVSVFGAKKPGGTRVVRVDVYLAAGILKVFGALIDQVNFGVE